MSAIYPYRGNTFEELPLLDGGAVYHSEFSIDWYGAPPVVGPTPAGPVQLFAAVVQVQPHEPVEAPIPEISTWHMAWAIAVVLAGALWMRRKR